MPYHWDDVKNVLGRQGMPTVVQLLVSKYSSGFCRSLKVSVSEPSKRSAGAASKSRTTAHVTLLRLNTRPSVK
jgi:hypothetical protein